MAERLTRRTLLAQGGAAAALLLVGVDPAEARRLTRRQERALRAAVRGPRAGRPARRATTARGSSSTGASTRSGRPRSCACATAPTCARSCAGRSASTSRSSPAPAATATTATRRARPLWWSISTHLDRISYADGSVTLGPGARLLDGLRRARAPWRDDPRRFVSDGRGRRARARRRHGPRGPRDGPHARPRHELRRRDRGRRAPARRRTATTCSGRCAAAAGASRS